MTPPAVLAFGQSPDSARAADRGLVVGLALVGTALLFLALLQYTLPTRADALYWGLNPAGVRHFQSHLGLGWLPRLGVDQFALAFRVLLLLLWSGYALAIMAGLQGATLRFRPLLAAVLAAALGQAVFGPPLLSHDVYAYAVHGRLFAIYGQNPYLYRPALLHATGDPAATFITWNVPTVYGPVWTWIEIGISALTRGAGLWPQIVLLKLVEAAALVAAALAGRRLAAHLSPGRENLTLLAIGLNPLLLLEGPGSGHNDLLMVSLLLYGAALFYEKKLAPALLLLGLSVGIKLLTLAVLPWVVMEWSRGRSGRQRLLGLATGLSAVLPLLLCGATFWHGGAMLGALGERASFHQSAAALARQEALVHWLTLHRWGTVPAHAGAALFPYSGCIVVFAALTLWLWKRPQAGTWLTAWGALAAALMFGAMGLPFPWYIAWFWPVFLLRWDRTHCALSAGCFALSLAWTSGYGIIFATR